MAERRHRDGTGGFTLVEVLIALTVLAVGLLGAATLAVDTVRSQNRAMMRSQALRLAADLAERMRGNRAGLLAYTEAPASSGCTSTTAAPGRRCTPAELAREEVAGWHAEIRRTLPGGRGELALAGPGGPTAYTVTIRWRWRDRDQQFALEGWL